MAYLTLAEFKAYIEAEIPGDDAFFADVLAATEDCINDFCGRAFDPPTVSSITRKYIPCGDTVVIHDIADTTNLVISDSGSTVTSGQYQLEPLNNLTPSGLVIPYHQIRLIAAYWQSPRSIGEATVSVTSTRWGWLAVPPKVKEATRLLGKDIAHLRKNRFGVAGFDEYGAVRVRENPHVAMLLSGLRHPSAYGIG